MNYTGDEDVTMTSCLSHVFSCRFDSRRPIFGVCLICSSYVVHAYKAKTSQENLITWKKTLAQIFVTQGDYVEEKIPAVIYATRMLRKNILSCFNAI